MSDELFIGMLSGTSRDGVDAVLVNFHHQKMEILHAACTPYPTAIKTTLDQLIESGAPPANDVAILLDENLGRFFARIAQNLLRDTGMETRDISAIGSHGQTVWHEPDGENPITIQLGKAELIAKGTNSVVVADFRTADLEAGGQGAPLAPLLHQKLFQNPQENRAVLNLGGIANLTSLPANGGVSGYDCGPGNCLMDVWTKRHLQKEFDDRGKWAASGTVNLALLENLMTDPYLTQPPPKSTGLEYYNSHWLDERLAGSDYELADVQATLAEFTAISIADCLRGSAEPKRLLVCGGGAHNTYLLRRIAAALPDVVVESTSRYGVDPDWVEALLFAWLARERLDEAAQSTEAITGAEHPVLLGSIHHPPAQESGHVSSA